MTKRAWTAEETEQLESLLVTGSLHKDIAAKLGRTIYSVRKRIEWLYMTPQQRELGRQRQIRRRQKKYKKSVHNDARTILNARPTPEMLAERDRRLALPAPAFGDPLPGYSALDRLRAVDKLS